MLNQEMRTVTMSRADMCRIKTALTSVMLSFDEGTGSPSDLSSSPSWTRRTPNSSAASNHATRPGGHEGRREHTMTNYWEADFLLVCDGREHVWRELTPEAQARIHHEFGLGSTHGELFPDDFDHTSK